MLIEKAIQRNLLSFFPISFLKSITIQPSKNCLNFIVKLFDRKHWVIPFDNTEVNFELIYREIILKS